MNPSTQSSISCRLDYDILATARWIARTLVRVCPEADGGDNYTPSKGYSQYNLDIEDAQKFSQDYHTPGSVCDSDNAFCKLRTVPSIILVVPLWLHNLAC